MYIVQRVLKSLENINHVIKVYILSIMLSKGRKNCAAMAHSIGISEKRFYPFLGTAEMHTEEIRKKLVLFASETRKKDTPRALVVDPTTIIKHYAEKMENVCHDRAGCTKKVEKGLVPVYVAVIDENVTIPLGLDFWVQEKIIGAKKYKSKIEITKELIIFTQKNKADFDFIVLDGAFSKKEMFAFFKQKKLKFSMRIAKSRVIQIGNGVFAQLKDHPALKLHRNQREKTIKAKFKKGDTYYYFTAHKRKTRDGGWETVYIVSNMNLSAKKQIAAYDLRLPIEPMIRTTKQKFGATQCQAVAASKQKAHIMAGFLAYTILQLANNDKQAKSVDSLVNDLRDSYFDDLISSIMKCSPPTNHQSTDPIVNFFQNNTQNSSKYSYRSRF